MSTTDSLEMAALTLVTVVIIVAAQCFGFIIVHNHLDILSKKIDGLANSKSKSDK